MRKALAGAANKGWRHLNSFDDRNLKRPPRAVGHLVDFVCSSLQDHLLATDMKVV